MAALTVVVANVLKSSAGQTALGTAGATITQGQPLYIDTAASNVLKPANASTAAASVVCGMALNAALTGRPVAYVTSDSAYGHGVATADVAAGEVIYLDDTAGGITKTFADLDAGDYVVVLGTVSATESAMQLQIGTAVVKA